MPTYIYETVNEPLRRFEVKQSINDPALSEHPETGEPVRRVISGGYGIMQKGGVGSAPPSSGGAGGCGSGCGCH